MRTNEMKKVIGETTVIGYLEQDEDCQSPFDDCDGMGELKLFRSGCYDHNHRIIDECYGNSLALPLEAYEHGSIVYALAREGNFPDREWDVYLCGYLMPDKYWIEAYEGKLKELGPEKAMEWHKDQARGIIETYNQWVSGDTWGYVVEVDGPYPSMQDFDESCWGFIGEKYALEELERVFNEVVEGVTKRTKEQQGWEVLHATG